MVQSETQLQIAISNWLRSRHPDILFVGDQAGVNKSRTARTQQSAMRSGRGWPDLFIATASNGYHGCFLELKTDKAPLFKKDGSLVADKHVRAQSEVLRRLRNEGYFAEFAQGFDDAIRKITDYLAYKPDLTTGIVCETPDDYDDVF